MVRRMVQGIPLSLIEYLGRFLVGQSLEKRVTEGLETQASNPASGFSRIVRMLALRFWGAWV